MNNRFERAIVCLYLFLFVIAGISSRVCGAEPGNIDSLKRLLVNVKTDTGKIKVLLALSDAMPCADTVEKIARIREALQLAERSSWQKGMINCNTSLARVYGDCFKNHTVAVKYLQRAASLAQLAGDKLSEADILATMAGYYNMLSQYSLAITAYMDALALHQGPDIDIGVLINMGTLYSGVGDYTNALSCYENGLHELDESMMKSAKRDVYDTLLIAVLLINKGDIYLKMKQADRALENYSNALKLTRQIKNKSLAVYALIGTAKTYAVQDEHIKAIEYYNKALEDCSAANDKKNQADILDQLANVYLDKGDINKAVACSQKAMKLAEEGNYSGLLAENYKTLGLIYTKLTDTKKAITDLHQSIDLSKSTGELEVQKDAWNALSKAYEQAKQPVQALDAYRQYITIRDSLYNIDRANALTRIDLKSDFARKQIADSVKHVNEAKVKAGEYKLKMQRQQVFTYGGFAGLAAVLLLSFFIYRNYNTEKKANVAITKANKAISAEKQVSETLLLNILPSDVADELKAYGKVKAKLFDNVSVLMTDFVDFTLAGERLGPEKLVEELHTCFEAFDNIIGKYKIEKIKTVGDAYMAVSGLPNANPDHASEVVRAALEIRDFMIARKKELGADTFGVRIGINSGKLVAGIVGVKKFAYDIWGDTVNTAARMEQKGEDGKINISSATYQLVKDDFVCTYRGEIDAKNKGMLKMYFVETLNS
jgi:adenylate cyclase